MDIPRIGSGGFYRPAQVWPGRTADSAVEDPTQSGAPGTRTPDALPTQAKTETKAGAKTDARPVGSKRAPGEPLSEDEQKQVDKLKAIDTKVRQHEAAHQAAGGGLAGGATFSYTEGPDGRRYAVGGEVPIRSGGGGSAEAKIAQLEQVKRAALAPADPSGQDLSVAASATASIAEARKELSATDGAGAAEPGSGQGKGNGEGKDGGERKDTKPLPGFGAAPPDGQGNGQVGAQGWDSNGTVPAHVARGMAAYGSAARINPAPTSAAGFFA